MELYANDFFRILIEDDKVYIDVFAEGFGVKSFDEVLRQLPRVYIQNFLNMTSALREAKNTRVEIGILRPRVEVGISGDLMEATVQLNLTEEEIAKDKAAIISELITCLKDHGVKDGILTNVMHEDLRVGRRITIAKGIPPVPGEDAVIRYFQMSERKPRVGQDGRVDFYEVNLIDQVAKGAWLGEKIPRTPGAPGRTVTGRFLPPKQGRDRLLKFDPRTVMCVESAGKTVLLAAVNGAVAMKDGKISVLNEMVIEGDVGPHTGSIDFDGAVIVRGTVLDGYSVIADKDISILGPLGIGAVNRIVSKQGDIFIKGGVFGKGKAYVEAKGNVFAKHANECTIKAEGDIHIGFYAMASDLCATNIILDQYKGKVIGGRAQAQVRVVASVIGSEFERPTVVSVNGFSRQELKKELDSLLLQYKNILTKVEEIQRELEVYEEYKGKIDEEEIEHYVGLVEENENLHGKVGELEAHRQALAKFLEMKGEGEVCIVKSAFPKTLIEIKHIQKRIESLTTGTFYVRDNQLYFE